MAKHRYRDSQIGGSSSSAKHFRVLFVCTANMCRSPMAEYLLRAAVQDRVDQNEWEIASAGVATRGGRRIHSLAAETLGELGIDTTGFRSQSLQAARPDQADLILAADREHRAQVVRAYPSVLPRIFTVNQLTYLVDGLDPLGAGAVATTGPQLSAVVRDARAHRPGRTVEDDIPDPVDLPLAAFRECASVLSAATGELLRMVPAPGLSGPH